MSQARRLRSLLGSVLIALSAGSTYAFSSYAPQLQEALHLSGTQLNVLGLAGNLGIYMSGPLWGRWIDRAGPHGAVMAGAVLVLTGYGVLSRAYKNEWSELPVTVLAFFCLLTGLGNSGGNNAAINAQAKSWSEDNRGSAMALVLSAFGLSAFVYSTLSHLFFSGNVTGYLDVLALGSFACFLVGAALLRITPPEENHGTHAGSYERLASEEEHRPAQPRRRSSAMLASETNAHVRDWIQQVADSNGDGAEEQTEQATSNPASTNNITGLELLRHVDFLLLFVIMGLISGAGLLMINNVGVITHALYNASEKASDADETLAMVPNAALLALRAKSKAELVQRMQALQVSCLSLGNAFGRLLIGVVSDVVVRATDSPASRTFLLIPVVFLGILSQGVAAWPELITDVHRLLFVSCLTGLMYGTLFGLLPVLVFEWFGLESFSQNWGWMSFSPVIFGNTYNLLFGHVYDSNVPRYGHSHRCLKGEECYRSVFVVTTVGCFVALAVVMVLLCRRVRSLGDYVSKRLGRRITIH